MQAFLQVPRERFLPSNVQKSAYLDVPLPIDKGQTISAPHMCIMMLEALELTIGQKILEIGTGSGYHAALCAEMVAPSKQSLISEYNELLPKQKGGIPQTHTSIPDGHVYSIERIESLADSARKNLSDTKYTDHVTVITNDGTLGYDLEAPFERILVTAAAPKLPKQLVSQLSANGILVIPVGKLHYHQTLKLIRKSKTGHITHENLCGVVFVPLIGENGWTSKPY